MEDTFAKYQRQISLQEIGLVGMKKIQNARVLLVGAGGLASSSLLYLAACGVGNIGIIDFDTIEISNLHRQVLYGHTDIGKLKALVAKEKLEVLHPNCNVKAYATQLIPDNAYDIFQSYDIIIDACDNIETRYVIEETCLKCNIPWVFAAINKFEAQLSVFNFHTPTQAAVQYSDVFPKSTLAEPILNCAEAGVLGILPGIVGSLQANEALKIMAGFGTVLSNSILYYNALHNTFYPIQIKP